MIMIFVSIPASLHLPIARSTMLATTNKYIVLSNRECSLRSDIRAGVAHSPVDAHRFVSSAQMLCGCTSETHQSSLSFLPHGNRRSTPYVNRAFATYGPCVHFLRLHHTNMHVDLKGAFVLRTPIGGRLAPLPSSPFSRVLRLPFY